MKKYTIQEIKKTNLDDTFFGTHFYRRISTYFTYFIAKTSLTPNQVSVLSLIFSLVGAFLYSFGTFFGFFFGNLSTQIGMILDYSDGQIARLKKKGTKRGAWLDVVLGMIQNNILILGIIIGLYVQTRSLAPLVIGFWTLFAWNMTCFVHLNGMIFFPNLHLKQTTTASKVKKRFKIKPQYLSIGSDVYFIVLGFASLFGLLLPALLFMAVLGNTYWIAVAIFMFKKTKNVK